MDTNNTDNILQVKDPGTMGNELLSVPGFVNELKDYTLAVSPRPNPPLAFAGALAMLAHLTVMRGGDSRASKMNEMVLRFFSESKSGHAMRLKAGQGRPTVIPLPHLTLFATGIPKFVYGALTSKALENGLLGRCLFIESDEFRRLQEPENLPLPSSCVETAAMMVEKEKRFNETYVLEPVIVTETDEARQLLRELRVKTDDLSEKLFTSDMRTSAALCCRLYEKAKKLALLWAISENPNAPVMTPDAVRWAAAFATHVTKKMLYEAQFNIAEGNFDRLKKRFLNLLEKHGGELDSSTLLKNLHVDAALFKRIAHTLEMCEQVESELLTSGKRGFKLSSAA